MNIDYIKGKKVIMYGDERYIRDFLYIFDELEPEYYVDDQDNDFADSWEKLKGESKEKIFIIICKYNEKSARKNLKSLGFMKGKDFASATVFFELLDFPIKKIAEERNVYVWGTGDNSHEFFHDYVERNPDVEIVGCVDSDPQKKNKTFFRRPVYLPDEVMEEDPFFIIASKKYCWEIKAELERRGKKENQDFIHYLGINTWASQMMRDTVYDVPRLDYVCPKMFKVAEIKPEGRLLSCSEIMYSFHTNIPVYYAEFQTVWKSNIMKVLRLSAINGTYTFCNTGRCSWLQNSGRQEIDTNEIHYQLSKSKSQLEYIRKKETLDRKTVFHPENYNLHELDFPEVFQCGWDETCNLHCPSCRKQVYIANNEKRKELMIFSDRIKRELYMPYAKRIKVAGVGEVFASEVYKKIIFDEELAKRVKSIGILSNGMLFTKENFDRLAELWTDINVFISMDGCTRETAEKLRAGVDFERWKENISYLGRMRQEGKIQKFAFNFVVQKKNYREMPDYAKMCLKFHADQIKFSSVVNLGNWTEEEFEEISMFDMAGKVKPELAEVLKDPIFSKPEIHLFRWIEW